MKIDTQIQFIQNAQQEVSSVQEKAWRGLQNLFEQGKQITPASEILAKSEISPRELILHQLKASNHHIRVELISRAAEGVFSTLRKFQNH